MLGLSVTVLVVTELGLLVFVTVSVTLLTELLGGLAVRVGATVPAAVLDDKDSVDVVLVALAATVGAASVTGLAAATAQPLTIRLSINRRGLMAE